MDALQLMGDVCRVTQSQANELRAERGEFRDLAWPRAQGLHLQHLVVIKVFRVGDITQEMPRSEQSSKLDV